MINIILSIVIFLVMFLLVATAESLLSRNENGEEIIFTGKEPKEMAKAVIASSQKGGAGRALIISLVPALTNFLLTKAPDLAVVFGVALIATMAYIAYWWHKGGSEIIEMLPFIGMEIVLFMELRAVCLMFSAKLSLDGFAHSIVSITPVVLLIGAVGFFVVDALAYNNKVPAKRAAAVATVAVIALTVLMNMKGGASSIATAAPGPWYHFYNSDLQNDEDKDNDFNFGPSAYAETTTAETADKEFRERLAKDPALGAADMAWLDSIVKTRFIGVFYDEADGAWDAAINKAKEGWLKAGEDEYKKVVNTFFNYLNKATKVEIIERTSGLDDQMYMNPVTIDGVPDVIVLETENHTGHFLRYTFEIKGEEFTVEYRLECGFQPCNVQAQMGIKPQNTPIVPTNTPEPSPSPTPTPTPTPEPEPEPEPKKDPSKSKVLPNDDDGPGENTNSGGRESTKDKPTNSNHMTYPEYKNEIEKLKEINENQRVGGDSNEPSTPTPPNTTVKSNAEDGTGNGGVDAPTPVKEPAKAAETKQQTGGAITETGQPITSESMGHWAGPDDN